MGWVGLGIVVLLVIALVVAVARRQRSGSGDGNTHDPIQNRDDVEAMRNPMIGGDQQWAGGRGETHDRNRAPKDT